MKIPKLPKKISDREFRPLMAKTTEGIYSFINDIIFVILFLLIIFPLFTSLWENHSLMHVVLIFFLIQIYYIFFKVPNFAS